MYRILARPVSCVSRRSACGDGRGVGRDGRRRARRAGPWLRAFRRESANSPQDSQPRPFTANETQRHREDVYAGQAHFPARARNTQRQIIRLLVVRALLRHLILVVTRKRPLNCGNAGSGAVFVGLKWSEFRRRSSSEASACVRAHRNVEPGGRWDSRHLALIEASKTTLVDAQFGSMRAEFNEYLQRPAVDGPFKDLDVHAQIAADALAGRDCVAGSPPSKSSTSPYSTSLCPSTARPPPWRIECGASPLRGSDTRRLRSTRSIGDTLSLWAQRWGFEDDQGAWSVSSSAIHSEHQIEGSPPRAG